MDTAVSAQAKGENEKRPFWHTTLAMGKESDTVRSTSCNEGLATAEKRLQNGQEKSQL